MVEYLPGSGIHKGGPRVNLRELLTDSGKFTDEIFVVVVVVVYLSVYMDMDCQSK